MGTYNNPWVRLHVEYLGAFTGKMFLVIVDFYPKWVEVFPISNPTSQTAIYCLRTCFATHGLPQFMSQITDRVLQAKDLNVL